MQLAAQVRLDDKIPALYLGKRLFGFFVGNPADQVIGRPGRREDDQQDREPKEKLLHDR